MKHLHIISCVAVWGILSVPIFGQVEFVSIDVQPRVVHIDTSSPSQVDQDFQVTLRVKNTSSSNWEYDSTSSSCDKLFKIAILDDAPGPGPWDPCSTSNGSNPWQPYLSGPTPDERPPWANWVTFFDEAVIPPDGTADLVFTVRPNLPSFPDGELTSGRYQLVFQVFRGGHR